MKGKKKKMKIQRVQSSSTPSFGALKRNPLTMSEEMFNSIRTIPVIDNFSKKYDAVVSFKPFVSNHDSNKVQMALQFSHIKPKNIIERLYYKFVKPPKYSKIVLKTKAVDEAGMYEELGKTSKNRLFEIYNK